MPIDPRLSEELTEIRSVLEEISKSPNQIIKGRHQKAFSRAVQDLLPKLVFPATFTPADEKALKDLGLEGDQLAFKLGVVREFREQYEDQRAKNPQKKGFFRKVRERLGYWLNAFKPVAGSLGRIFPALDALNEILEATTLVLDEW